MILVMVLRISVIMIQFEFQSGRKETMYIMNAARLHVALSDHPCLRDFTQKKSTRVVETSVFSRLY